jgi:hypothetical protein
MTGTRIHLEDLYTYAASLVSGNGDAPTLRCDYCAEEVDTFRGAHDDATAAVFAFLNHTAFDHSGRADIISYTPRPLGRVETLGEQEYRLASQEPETGAQGVSEYFYQLESTYTFRDSATVWERAFHRSDRAECTRAWTRGDCPENHLYGPDADSAV